MDGGEVGHVSAILTDVLGVTSRCPPRYLDVAGDGVLCPAPVRPRPALYLGTGWSLGSGQPRGSSGESRRAPRPPRGARS